jgi:hypothetical protein
MRTSLRPGKRTVGWLLLSILVLTACGCSRTATVTGKVTYQGRPVVHGFVTFLSAQETARSGVIQPDGSYTVENVPLGRMRITVFSRNPAKGRSTVRVEQPAETGDKKAGSGKPTVAGWFPLPPKFEAVATSGLTCTVDARTMRHDLELN